jgi:hypothetical protein
MVQFLFIILAKAEIHYIVKLEQSIMFYFVYIQLILIDN